MLRGYVEDSAETQIEPGTAFDLTVPIWRAGECLLHAAKLAALLAPDRDLRVLLGRAGTVSPVADSYPIRATERCWGITSASSDEFSGEATIDDRRALVNLYPKSSRTLVAPLLRKIQVLPSS